MPDLTDSSYSQSPSAAPTLLQSVLRRWPLLVIGAVAGLVAGFLGYAALPPTYQSTAQLQVIKRDNHRMELRAGYIDDYVANQLELLRSETIHLAAAKTQKMQEASPEFLAKLNADDLSAHKVIKTGLTVARSRESGSGIAGNSIVNLAFVSDNPRDAQLVLDAIIATYQEELKGLSNTTTKERIAQLNSRITELGTRKDEAQTKKVQKTGERQRINPEPPDAIVQRWSQSKADLFKVEMQLSEIVETLEAIARVGNGQSDRVKFIQMLSNSRRGLDPNMNSLENQLLILELRQEQQAGELGKDHPRMKEVEGQIKLVKAEMTRLNPNKDGDDLSLHELNLTFKKRSLESHKAMLVKQIDMDKKDLESIRPLLVEMDQLQAEVVSRDKQIFDLGTDLAAAESAQKASQTEVYEARVNNKPRPGLKVGPVLLLWLAPGLFLGGLVGAGLAMLVELRDKSFRTPAEIRARLGVPVLGHLPNIRLDLPREADVSAAYDASLVTATRPKSVESEAYRGVRAQVMQMCEGDGHAVVQVTSPTPGDGKSTLAANLAISLAQSGKRVVLLDCDFRKPKVHKLFDLPKPEVGLASVTGGQTELDEAIRHSDVDRLDLLPCGPRPSNPAELLAGPRFHEVLKELKSRYDFVIVDTPPLLAVSDPRVVAQRVDGVVLVFRITNKVRPLAERAKEYLTDMGAKLLGVVVNGGGGKGDEYGYGYGYSYAYAYDYDYEYAETYSTEEKSKF